MLDRPEELFGQGYNLSANHHTESKPTNLKPSDDRKTNLNSGARKEPEMGTESDQTRPRINSMMSTKPGGYGFY